MSSQTANRMIASSAIVAMLSVPATALAHSPPLPPPQYQAYGPLQICTDLYTVDIGANEAVHVVDDFVRIINDRELLALKIIKHPKGNFARSPEGSIALGNQSRAYRYALPTPDESEAVKWEPLALRENDVRYAIEAPGSQTGDILLVGATSFKGDSSDHQTLSRIGVAANQQQDCIDPVLAVSSLRITPRPAIYESKASYWANIYPPVWDYGPRYYCAGGLGFSVLEGEKLRRPWKPLGPAGQIYVESDGAMIKLEGPQRRLKRADPSNAKEHPLSLLSENAITYFPSRGTGPPYAAKGVRERSSWQVTLDKDNYGGLKISFPAEEKNGVGFSFLERLEFVDEGDPRCVTQRLPPAASK